MNSDPSVESLSSKTTENEICKEDKEETLPNQEGEAPTKNRNVKDAHFVETNTEKTSECALDTKELPGKSGDTIIDILTEKNVDSIIENRRKTTWVYLIMEPRSSPAGDPFDYGEGSRNDFVRLVFMITASMLLVSTAFVFMVYKMPAVKDFLTSPFGMVLLAISAIGNVVLFYAYFCSDCMRQQPMGWIGTVLTTIFYSYLLGYIALRYDENIVLCAAGTTCIVTMVCYGLALTNIDFTKFILVVMLGFLALLFATLFLVVLHYAFGIKMSTGRKVILVIATILSCVSLIIDFQMVIGGKTMEIGEEDYCFAAFLLYTSIIDLFLRILRLYSEFSD